MAENEATRELIDPVTGLTLHGCLNPKCGRLCINTVEHCCGECSIAHELDAEPIHSGSCNLRWITRKTSLSLV